LAKEPDARWQSARDLLEELNWIVESGSSAGVLAPLVVQRGIRERLSWVLTAVSLLVATVLAVVVVNLRSEKQEPFRFLITPPANPNSELTWNIAISPDGRRLAFVAPASGGTRWHPLDLNALGSACQQCCRAASPRNRRRV
jgi:hypothetical protein